MTRHIDYYFATVSPWTYLGHDRFVALAKQHGATVGVKPMNLGEVFPVSGGLPLAKRAPQRQAYRLVELKRWSEFLGVPMNLQPKHFPADGTLSSCWLLAADEQGGDKSLALMSAFGRALWAEDRDIADAVTLASIARNAGLDADALAKRASDLPARYAALTQEAIARNVFGAPTYVFEDELFWGQDRLDFLARKLAK